MAKEQKTKVDNKGQIELSIDETPLYKTCERMVQAKSKVMGAKKEMELAEKDWCEEMKRLKKSKINHKGDIIQFVTGKTTEDHARFVKA